MTVDAQAGAQSNLPAIAALVGSMAAYSTNDALMKLLSETMPSGETIFLRSAVSALLAAAMVAVTGGFRLSRDLVAPTALLRVVGELGASVFFLLALFAMPIGSVTAIVQIVPLTLTAASAIILKEAVGWRRWVAALLGLVGVALIIRPGSELFTPAAFLAVGAVLFITLRDMATAFIPRTISSQMLTLVNTIAIVPLGLAFLPFEIWRAPTLLEWAYATGAAACIIVAIYLLILSVRLGDVSAVAPFRYTIVPFAILFQWAVWGDLPDRLAMIGIAIIVLAGVYTLQRSARHRTRPTPVRPSQLRPD